MIPPGFGTSVVSSSLSSNVPIILKIPFSSLDDDTVLALKTNNDRTTKIGSNVLIDGNVNASYLNGCLSKGNVSVLLIGNKEQGAIVKSYSSSQVTSVDYHIPISPKFSIFGKEYLWYPDYKMRNDDITVRSGEEGNILFSHPSIIEQYYFSMKIAFKMFEAARNKPNHSNPFCIGRCKGIAVIFNSSDQTGSTKATCIYLRIPYLALASDPPNKWYISTRNFNRIPFLVRGFVMAYTPKKISSSAQFSVHIESAEWKLGVVASMDERTIVIANVSKSIEGIYEILGFEVFPVGSTLTIHYLNAIAYKSVCKNGFVVASGINPDMARMLTKDKELMRKTAESYILPKLSLTNTYSMKKGTRNTSFFMDRMSQNKKNKGSMATRGTHVIVVEFLYWH